VSLPAIAEASGKQAIPKPAIPDDPLCVHRKIKVTVRRMDSQIPGSHQAIRAVDVFPMRQFFKFWWLCVRIAFRGNTAFANDWQWLFGVPVCSGLAAFVARQQGISELTTGNAIADAVLAALGAFVVTWLEPPFTIFAWIRHQTKRGAAGGISFVYTIVVRG
jgi:hypothetical protein